jgi:hypothetical protein
MTSQVFSPVTKLPMTKVLLDLRQVSRIDSCDYVMRLEEQRLLLRALSVQFHAHTLREPMMLLYSSEEDRELDAASIRLASSLSPYLFAFAVPGPPLPEEEKELEAAENSLRLFDPAVPVPLADMFEADL